MTPDEQIVAIRMTTNSGIQLNTTTVAPGDLEQDELAASFADELATRPRWMTIGNITFFSGAISAIEVNP